MPPQIALGLRLFFAARDLSFSDLVIFPVSVLPRGAPEVSVRGRGTPADPSPAVPPTLRTPGSHGRDWFGDVAKMFLFRIHLILFGLYLEL